MGEIHRCSKPSAPKQRPQMKHGGRVKNSSYFVITLLLIRDSISGSFCKNFFKARRRLNV